MRVCSKFASLHNKTHKSPQQRKEKNAPKLTLFQEHSDHYFYFSVLHKIDGENPFSTKEAIVATCYAILLGVVIGSIIFFLHQNSPEDMDDDETTRLSTSTRILQEQDYITIKSTLNLALKDAVMANSLLHYSSRNSSSSSSSNNSSSAEEFLIMVCKKQLRDSIDDLQRCNAKLDDVISSSSSPRWDLDDLRKWLTEAKMKEKTCLDNTLAWESCSTNS